MFHGVGVDQTPILPFSFYGNVQWRWQRVDLAGRWPDLGSIWFSAGSGDRAPWLRAAEAISPGFTARAIGLLFARRAYDVAAAMWWLPPLHIVLLMLAPALDGARCYGRVWWLSGCMGSQAKAITGFDWYRRRRCNVALCSLLKALQWGSRPLGTFPCENPRTDLQVRTVTTSWRCFPLVVPFWSSWNDDIRSIWRVRGAREHKKQLVEWSWPLKFLRKWKGRRTSCSTRLIARLKLERRRSLKLSLSSFLS